MAEKSALYLSIARRSAADGQAGRAIITIVNALGNNPKYIETQPEALDLLAEILEPGYEEEIHRLEIRYPVFGQKLTEALVNKGRAGFAQSLDESFNAYCIEQMKRAHESACWSNDFSNELQSQISGEFDVAQADFQFVAEDAGMPDTNTIQYPDRTRSDVEFRQQSGEFCWTSKNTGGRDARTAPCEWMISAAEADARKNIRDLTRHDYKKEENCTVDLNRRFDRVRTIHETAPKARDYADDAVDRVIIDFDNTVKETPKSAMFAAGQLKIRSYAEEIAEFREREASRPSHCRRSGDIVNDPMELVAETTHSLSETPSVEPYAVRHPLRFHVSPQVMFTCVFVCILGMMGWILWQNITPSIEEKTFRDVTRNYISAAESGDTGADSVMNPELTSLVDETWMKSYQLFLDVWQNIHFERDPLFSVDPGSPDFPVRQSAAQAAAITWMIANGEAESARAAYDGVSAGVWREHPYFQLWAQAQLDEASRDYAAAALKYENLLRSPLASFALTQIGLMALEPTVSQNDLQAHFLHAYDQAETPTRLSACIQAVLKHGETARVPSPDETRNLAPAYRAYCVMGRLFHSQAQQALIYPDDLEELKSYQPIDRGDYYRTEAIITTELYLHHAVEAVAAYQGISLPAEHPFRVQLRNRILDDAMFRGDWSALYAMYPDLPKNMGYLAAAHVIDLIKGGTDPQQVDLRFQESLVKYGVKEPSAVSDPVEEAYAEARHGHTEHALAMTNAMINRRPDAIEPLLLRAEILAHAGQEDEAASMLEQAVATGNHAMPLVVMAALYRARAGHGLAATADVMSKYTLKDPVLESARCEILWRHHHPAAAACIQRLSSQPGRQAKAAWIMRHLHQKANSQQWLKAGSDQLSFPGYHLMLARIQLTEDQWKPAIQSYKNAILFDRTTASPDTVYELENVFVDRQRRYEGTKLFESMIEAAESSSHDNDLLGALHMAAARLYQPKSAHPMARRHLSRALELLGENTDILSGLVQYYEAKDKPDHARSWRLRLNKLNKAKEQAIQN